MLAKILDLTSPIPSPDVVPFDRLTPLAQQEVTAIFAGYETAQSGLAHAQQTIHTTSQQATRGA